MSKQGPPGPPGPPGPVVVNETGERGPKGDPGPARVEPIHPYRWRALTVWILLFTCLVGWDHHRSNDLIDQNRDLIHHNEQATKQHDAEVQASRIHSCEVTYSTLRKALVPLASPKKSRTPKEQAGLDRFLRLTNPAKCKIQTDPNNAKKGG